MAKSFIESISRANTSVKQIQNDVKETSFTQTDETEHNTIKSKPGRKPTRKAKYIKCTVDIREELINKIDESVYENRSSKREEIERALELYFSKINK